jgi:hypothetical protein
MKKLLSRIIELTGKKEIEWNEVETKVSNCIRFKAVGLKHIFVIMEFTDGNKSYSGYTEKGKEQELILISDNKKEMDMFLKIIKPLARIKEKVSC